MTKLEKLMGLNDIKRILKFGLYSGVYGFIFHIYLLFSNLVMGGLDINGVIYYELINPIYRLFRIGVFPETSNIVKTISDILLYECGCYVIGLHLMLMIWGILIWILAGVFFATVAYMIFIYPFRVLKIRIEKFRYINTFQVFHWNKCFQQGVLWSFFLVGVVSCMVLLSYWICSEQYNIKDITLFLKTLFFPVISVVANIKSAFVLIFMLFLYWSLIGYLIGLMMDWYSKRKLQKQETKK